MTAGLNMEERNRKIAEIGLVLLIFLLSFLIVNKSTQIFRGSTTNNASSAAFVAANASGINSFSIPFASGSSSSLVTKNEFLNTSSNSQYYSNIFFNEKFYPGNVSSNSNTYSCSAVNTIIAPHLCFSFATLFSCGGGPTTADFSNLVGYIGFPQQDNNFPNNGGTNYSNLYSAVSNGSSQNVYQLPSSTFEYQNFINWSASSIRSYGFSSSNGNPYLYAINHSFTGYPTLSGSIPSSTLIIPAVSCGSTFINNYINYPGFIGTLYNISTLSGFTPSVYLASKDENGFGAYYAFGYLLSLGNLPWTGSFNSLLAYQIQSINPAFSYTMPTEDYAEFPKGNRGDMQYVNSSNEFLTPLQMSYYESGNTSNVSIYVSNTSISSIAEVSSTSQVCSSFGPHGVCNSYKQAVENATSADTFTDPNLEGVYYPNYANGIYVQFRTDGIFPICAWNSTTSNTLSSCTFEKPSTINNISYQRLWLSNNIKNNQLYNSNFAPGQSSSPENSFTLTALDSFCFYGENFNTANGVYTSPSYSRIIPPTSTENYTSAIGTCNAFFNSTNCFSSRASQYLNFQDGIFANNIACTPTGIHAKNVTDAWIRSIYVANNAGDFCGDFLGQKNPSDPQANSTVFLQTLNNNCPSFNSNSSSVNLVITVKNVGNTQITNPYLVALYGNNNLSNIFYNSQNSQQVTYSLYQDFLSSMKATTGIIQVDYNNNFDTNMYVFDAGHPLNPIPIESLFSSGQQYENGPFNNSLLGMWIYSNGAPNNVIRTSNTILSHSTAGTSAVPVIQPNGTATFTLEVPMSLFKALLSGKYNLSVFFGNTFNVTWNTLSSTSPQTALSNPGTPVTVNPLVSSSDTNASQTHNNEIITGGKGAPSPLWQYIVSYDFNFSKAPFNRISIYNDNLSINVSSVNSTSSALNVTVNPSVSVLNGSGSYKLGLNQLKGSAISCFASPDNVQDFGVFWSKQIVSPSNLNYALSNSIYSDNQQQASNVLITSWRGILFMPYSDQVALNYNNLPHYYPATSSFQIETPTLNSTSKNFNYEAFDYFGSGTGGGLFSNLSDLYGSLNSSVTSFPVSLPNSSLTFHLTSNSLVSDPSILRIVGTDLLVNYSVFSNRSFTFSLVTKGSVQCTYSESTSSNGTFEYGSGGSSCLNSAVINSSYINISSKYGPFFADMYNNSNLNMSNETAGGTVLMAGNETLSKQNKGGLFTITLPINTSTNNGIALVFSVVPLTRQLYNSDVYLYNLNGTPFNCNILNDFNNTGNLGVSQIGRGKYFLPNGTMMCNLTGDFTYLRAVFINRSNNAYLGSGDIQSGVVISNISGSSAKDELNISINGIPVNAQNANILPGKYSSCSLTDKTIYNGILRYPTGCDNLSYSLITFDYNVNGSILPESALISPKNYYRHYPQFLYSGPSVVSTNPTAEYNLTLPASSAENVPIQFSIPNNFGGCNNIILTTQNPYPYAEVPYQVILSGSQSCDYVFVGSGGNSYSVFVSSSPAVGYPDNWMSYNATQYNVQLSTSLFNGDLISNCRSGFGPCLDSFSVNGKDLGSLLFNNVSTSSATISQSLKGPVEDCFTVSYSSSQTVEFPETGFGGINYANNKIYQTAAPSQSIASDYCFYAGSPVITDSITARGSPITFKVQNQLISNFSYLENSNLKSFYVPAAINVGYSSYGSVNVSTSKQIYYNISSADLLTKCINYTISGANASALGINQITPININSNDILTNEQLYCLYGGSPSYTTQLPLSGTNNANSSTSVGFAYQPGNYTAGTGTLYDSCIIPPKLKVSSPAVFYLNGKASDYNPSNSGENYTASHSANSSGLEMLYSPGSSVFINKCAPNSTILSYSACTKPVNIVPQNGSYNSLEALPTGSNGNLSFGGGCFIGSIGTTNYKCAPTDGELSFSNTTGKSSSSTSVSISQVILNSTSAPTTSFSVSFDCSVSASNSTVTKLFSCSYPNSQTSGACSASVSYKQINSTAYNIISTCSVSSVKGFTVKADTVKISKLSITGGQSETTGLISDFICGNTTNVISKNIPNGWNWKPYSTAGAINPAPSTNKAGVAEVGGCEAGRDTFETQQPTISITTPSSNTFQYSYSCQSGYSGTITACSQPTSLPQSKLEFSSNNKCGIANITLINTTFQSSSVNGKNNGGEATSCNPFSKSGFSQPTVQDNCIAYHNPAFNSTTASYELQYANSSGYGIGMGVLGGSYNLNISIPNNKQQNSVKDAYLTGLSESQIESGNNILTDLLPTSLLESNLPSKALSISAAYSYDMLNILMLQNPSLGVTGIPGFINGSILDYALSIFTGGTSGNCAPPYNVSGDGIFKLGEGELCSGKTLPSSYKEGVFLSLGTLNEGLHSLQFYSIGNSTNEAQPSVNVFDSVGNAVNLNSACSNGNKRVFTSVYKGGTWSFNMTSDQQCNPVNNKLYGYIVNCLYQTPGNSTYTITSQYYLAYNLPTIWNISYTLLVSPKSYEVVPAPVYQINYSTGSILTLQQPNKTVFIEKGLPAGYRWTVDYNGVSRNSISNEIYFYSVGTHSFTVPVLQNSSITPDCYTRYTPAPGAGQATSGTTTYIQFSSNTTCYSYFTESGLPSGFNWNVTYDGVTKVSGSSNIEFITINPGGYGGNFSYSVPDIKTTSAACTEIYIPSPSSGYLAAGTNQSVVFTLTSDTCITTFDENGLPSGHAWTVDYNGTTETSSTDKITFTSAPGTPSYSVSAPSNSSATLDCTTYYFPSPSSGHLTAGTSLSISFSSKTHCTTTFTETGLPSNVKWYTTYDKDTSSAQSPNKIVFSKNTTGTAIPSYSYSVQKLTASSSSLDCSTTYTPSPSSSSSLNAGSSIKITFTTSTSCVTTFKDSELNSGYNWAVYGGSQSSSGSTSSNLQLTTSSGTYSYSASITTNGIDCYSSGSFSAGSTITPSFTCQTEFYVSQYHSVDSGATWSVSYNGSSESQPSPNDNIFFYESSNSSLKIPFTAGFSVSNIGTWTEYPHPGSGSLISGGTQAIWYGYS